MISRRHPLSTLGFLGIGSFLFKNASAQSNGKQLRTDEKDKLPPHCEALPLVQNSQQKLIREVETLHAKAEQAKQKEYISAESRWWFDAEERNWEVTRPVEPGTLDSTLWFNVYYSINGKVVAQWFVDTREKRVDVVKTQLTAKSRPTNQWT